jgi:hypothetical protein
VTVNSGDTLSAIASKNVMSTSQLIALNPQITNPNLIQPGQSINLSSSSSSTAQTTQTNNSNSFDGSIINPTTGEKRTLQPFQSLPDGFKYANDPSLTTSKQTDTTNPAGVTAPQPTGNKSLDDILKGMGDFITGSLANGFAINPGLSITPSVVGSFITQTASQLNPQLQQSLTKEMTDVNQAIGLTATQYQNQQGQTVQDYQQSLGNLRDQTSMSGGGERALEQGLTNSANRSLSTLDAQAAQSIGSQLRAGGSQVGAGFAGSTLPADFGGGSIPGVTGNASSFNIPSLYGLTLSNQGGDSTFAGSTNGGNPLNFNYNPSTYGYGVIPGAYANDFLGLLNTNIGNYLSGQAATGNSNILSSYGNTL